MSIEHFSDRDLAAMEFIGRGYEVAQYQLHRVIFSGRAPTVVSRFVRRTTQEKLVRVHRQHCLGENRLSLSARGVEFLRARHDFESNEFFAPRKPVALKDVAHTTFINDIVSALASMDARPDDLHPAWLLQRRLGVDAVVVPDVLAIWRRLGYGPLVLAFEVDLGCEPLHRVFLPKLFRLNETIRSFVPAHRGAAIVFTRGKRRRSAIAEVFAQSADAIHVYELPDAPGRRSIEDFAAHVTCLRRYMNSTHRWST